MSDLHSNNNGSKDNKSNNTNNKPNPIMLILDRISISEMHTCTECHIETVK